MCVTAKEIVCRNYVCIGLITFFIGVLGLTKATRNDAAKHMSNPFPSDEALVEKQLWRAPHVFSSQIIHQQRISYLHIWLRCCVGVWVCDCGCGSFCIASLSLWLLL